MAEVVQANPPDLTSSHVQRADCTPDELAERRYVKALDELITDAWNSKRMNILADSLAWTVARIAVGCGMTATGDILRRIGRYVGEIEARRQAAKEAQQARQEGHLPN
jgi:hypothetical protein